jgi:hypothetical protein
MMALGWRISPVPIGTWNSTIQMAKVWHCLATFEGTIAMSKWPFGSSIFRRFVQHHRSGILLQIFLPFQLVNYMTTTFAPEEGSVRNELTLFKSLFSISILFGIGLLVLALSLGYNVCTRPMREAGWRRGTEAWHAGRSPAGRTEMERISSL